MKADMKIIFIKVNLEWEKVRLKLMHPIFHGIEVVATELLYYKCLKLCGV